MRSSLSWALLGQGAVALISLAGMVVLARLLTPAEMGIYAVSLATSVLLGVISTLGAAAYIVREPDLPREKTDTAFTINATLNIVLAGLILAVASPVSRFLSEPAVADVLRWLAVRPLLAIIEFRPSALLQREMNFQTPAFVGIASAISNVGATLTAASLGESYFSLVYGTLTGGVTSALLLNVSAWQHASFRLSFAYWRPVLLFGLRMITISGTPVLAQRLCEVIMGRLLGMPAVGLFTRATQISDLLFISIYGTFTRVTFARMAKDHREKGSVTESFLWAVEVITVVMWPILLGIAVLAPALIDILYGKNWTAAAYPLVLLMAAQFIATLFAMNWELFVIRNETPTQTRIEVVRALSSVAAFTLGCLVSMTAAAAGRITDCLVGLAFYRKHILRLADLQIGALGKIYRRSFVFAVCANIPNIVLMTATGWSSDTELAGLAIACIIGVSIWLALIVRNRHPVWDLLRNR